MYNIVLIAYDDLSNGLYKVPILDTNEEIPVLPTVEPSEEKPSEVEYVAGKSFISFGITLAAIIFIVLAALILKKHKTVYESEVKSPAEPVPKKQIIKKEAPPKEEEYDIPTPMPIKQKAVKNYRYKLSTPNTIQQCIRKFLDITK